MLSLKHLLLYCFLFDFCSEAKAQIYSSNSITSVFNKSESITGKSQYLNTPYNTAGDRLYMVGNQDGTFPDLGWHVKGEMGGIWHHPIKLLDGFEASVTLNNKRYELNKADAF